jgi:hypothetical protein
MEEILVVSAGAEVFYVGTSKVQAEEVLSRRQEESPGLSWGIRSVGEAIQEAYNAGRDDGFDDGYSDGYGDASV